MVYKTQPYFKGHSNVNVHFDTHFCNIHQYVPVDKSITYTPSDSPINTLQTNLLNIEKFHIPMVTVEFVESQLNNTGHFQIHWSRYYKC